MKNKPTQPTLAQWCLSKKSRGRQQRAAMAIEEKIKALLRLQRLANDIRRKTGRQVLPEWII